MAGAYLVTLDQTHSGHTLPGGFNAAVVYAADASDAKAIAKAQYSGDADAMWTAATATAITAGSLSGIVLEVAVAFTGSNFTGREYTLFTVTADSDDTMDDIGGKLRDALNADADLALITYTSGSQLITIPDTQNLGDIVITAAMKINGVSIPSLAPSVNAVGAAASQRTITLPADAAVVPKVTQMVKI